MLLHLSTWSEIEAYLERSKTIVIPIGSTEQHGPTGLLGTDFLCAEIIARQMHEAGTDVLIGPTFNVGTAQHHLGFAGTISLRPSTFIAAIGDWVRSLAVHGFERIYFLNGHGGNIASIEAAFSELYAEASLARRRAGFVLKLGNWWELPGVMALARELYPVGMAATPSRRRSQSRNLPTRPASKPPDTRRRSHLRGRSARLRIFAPATPTAVWAPIPLSLPLKRERRWFGRQLRV